MKKCIFDRHKNGGCVYSSDYDGEKPVIIHPSLIVNQTAKYLSCSFSRTLTDVGCSWLKRDGLLQVERCSERNDRHYLCEVGEYNTQWSRYKAKEKQVVSFKTASQQLGVQP